MVKSDKKLCFVIGPIGRYKSRDRTHADTLLSKIIKPTFAKNFRDFKVVRADHIARPGMIDSQVITHLIEAELVIADITFSNANAFYELGIRHLLQKPVIHLFKRGQRIPADIALHRAIEFDYKHPDDVRGAKKALRTAISEARLPSLIIDNPVTRSAGFMQMQKQSNLRKKGVRWAVPAPSLHDAPAVTWSKQGDKYTATWMAIPYVAKSGYKPKTVPLWTGTENKLTPAAKKRITKFANVLQSEMWDRITRSIDGD